MALSIIHWESDGAFGPADLRGLAGEIGPGQILPSTADQFGFDRRRLATDWNYSVDSSTSIMHSLLDRFPQEQAIAAYNGGPGFQSSPAAVQEKIRNYTANVLALQRKYEGVRCD